MRYAVFVIALDKGMCFDEVSLEIYEQDELVRMSYQVVSASTSTRTEVSSPYKLAHLAKTLKGFPS